MPVTGACPHCESSLRLPDEVQGQQARCPHCGTIFTAPAAHLAPPPVPVAIAVLLPDPPRDDSTRVLPDAYPRRPALRDDTFSVDEDPWQRANLHEVDRRLKRRSGLNGLAADYSVDLKLWLNHAMENYTTVIGEMIGHMVVSGLICATVFGVPYLGLLAQLFINRPLAAGFTIVSLAQLKGKPWKFSDFSSGFKFAGALTGNFFLQLLIIAAMFIPTLIAGGIALANQRDDMIAPVIVVGVVNLVPAMYVSFRTSCFGAALIVDRQCGAFEAIVGSWRLSSRHSLGLFCSGLVVGLIAMSGILLLGIGVIFTVPFAILTWSAGYLVITGNPPRRLGQPNPLANEDHAAAR